MSKHSRAEEQDQDELAEEPGDSSRSQNQEPPHDKQGRLLSLAQKLQELFPKQYYELAQVIEGLSSKQQTIISVENVAESEQGLVKSLPVPIPGKKSQGIKGHSRAASGGSTILHDRTPEQKDPLIHIFVDQYV